MQLNRTVTERAEGKAYKFTALAEIHSKDSTLLVVMVEWKHGIYRTDEHVVLNLFCTADGEDTVIEPGGTTRVLDASAGPGADPTTFDAALGRALAALV